MHSTRLFFLFVIFWLLAGWGIWMMSAAGERNNYVLALNKLSSPEFTIVLHNLFVERTTLLNTYLTDIYDNRDTSDTTQQLSTNTQKLADIVEVLSNKSDRAMFVVALQKHVNDSELYATGLKERDDNKLELSQQLLDADTTDFGKVIHTAFPSISQSYARTWLKEQNILMITSINSYATNDREKQYDTLKDSSIHASNIADQLVKAIQVKKAENK